MSFQEKSVWLYTGISFVTMLTYLLTVVSRAQSTPLIEVAYIGPMLWCIGSAIVASIVGHIIMAITWPKEANKIDIRDREIERFGEYAGQAFMVLGGVMAMALSMLRVAHFWIANAVYICFALSALLGSAAKIYAYRRGIPRC